METISKAQKYKFFSIQKKILATNPQKNIEFSLHDADSRQHDPADMPARLMPPMAESSRFTLVCRRGDYSAGRIAAAIEDCNANIVNLNVTSDTGNNDELMVDIRVDRKNIDSIRRSLERYDYTVVSRDSDGKFASVSDSDAEKAQQRAAEILRYLDI